MRRVDFGEIEREAAAAAGRVEPARTMPSTNTRGAIVYLTQLRHSSYGRDSLGLLKRCAIAHDRTQTHIIQT